MSNITTSASIGTKISVWFYSMPLVTRSVMIFCSALLLGEYLLGFYTAKVCILPPSILYRREYWRLMTGAWFHGGILHILLNMMTLQGLGTNLERQMGSLLFFYLILLFDLLISSLHLILAASAHYSQMYSGFMNECTVGFSGILFAFVVINTNSSESAHQSLFGFSVPTKLYPWAMLFILQFIMPGVSFLGHMSGILVGFAYTFGFLNWLIPSPSKLNWFESNFTRWILSRDGYISNPNLGSNATAPSLLPIFRFPTSQPQVFAGTGQVLGGSNRQSPTTARPEDAK